VTLGDSAGDKGGAHGREFPFRPGAAWEKQFISGRHASAVSDSPSGLESQWLSQTKTPKPDADHRLDGGRFMGLDNVYFGEHWRTVTMGFGEEAEGESVIAQASWKRGKYNDGTHKKDMSDRQQRRIGAELFKNFEIALAESFPAHEFAHAFQALYETRPFRAKYEPLFHPNASQRDEARR